MTIPAIAPELSPDDDVEPNTGVDAEDELDEKDADDEEYETEIGDDDVKKAARDVAEAADDIAERAAPVELPELYGETTTESTTNA